MLQAALAAMFAYLAATSPGRGEELVYTVLYALLAAEYLLSLARSRSHG